MVIGKVKGFVEHQYFQNFIIVVIVFNSVILGIQTSSGLDDFVNYSLEITDAVCLTIFIIEIILKEVCSQ